MKELLLLHCGNFAASVGNIVLMRFLKLQVKGGFFSSCIKVHPTGLCVWLHWQVSCVTAADAASVL